MRLFNKKNKKRIVKNNDLICIKKFIQTPPERYSKPKLMELDSNQYGIYSKLLEYFQRVDLELPIKLKSSGTETLEKRLLTSWEKFWLTRECLLRYLCGSDWNLDLAQERIRNSLIWRREFGITYDEFSNSGNILEILSNENKTGKFVLLGYDRSCRPILIIKTALQNTEPSFAQLQHLIYFIEFSLALCPQGVDKICVIIDFKLINSSKTSQGIDLPRLPLIKQALNIIQDHYPERLEKILVCNLSEVSWIFLKLIHPFINLKTRERIHFDIPFESYFDSDQLQYIYNGKLNFCYDHEIYWPDLIKTVETRRLYQYNRFLKFGGIVGLSEYDLKGSSDTMKYQVDFSCSNNSA